MGRLQQGLVLISTLLVLSGCIFEDTNTEPVASNINLDASNGVDAIVIEKSFLLSNVTDDDSSKLSISAFTIVNGFGDLTESSSAWTYTPSIRDFSDIRFSYTVTDGEFSNSASVRAVVETDSRALLQETGGVTLFSKLDNSKHASVKATLYIGSDIFSITSSNKDGSFAFINVPESSTYLLELSSENTSFATYYSAGTVTRNNNQDTLDLGVSQLPNAVSGVFKIRNAQNGELVSGLRPYIFANELANQDGSIANLPQIRVFLTENEQQYSLALASDATTTNVYLDNLNDVNGDTYNIINPQGRLPFIGRISGSAESNVFLSKVETGAFKVSLTLTTTPNTTQISTPLLAVTNLTNGQTEFWQQESANVYTNTLTAQQLNQRRVVQPIDTNADGVVDLIADINSGSGFPMLSPLQVSQFDENNQLALTQPIISIEYTKPMSSHLVSSAESFRANSNAEVIIAFDRQINLPNVAQINIQALRQSQVQIDLNSVANIYQADKETLTTTLQGESQLTLGSNNLYSYTDQNGQVRTLSLSNNGTNQITSPFVTEFTSTIVSNALPSNSFTLEANGTLLIINVNPSQINPFQSYEFSFTVDAPFDALGASSISHQLRAQSGPGSLLADVLLDNFDFKDASTLDITNLDNEAFIQGMQPHEDLFAGLNVGYAGGASTDRAQLKYVDYSIGELTSIQTLNSNLSLDSSANTIYLISRSAIEGTATIISQTEVFNNSGSSESSTTEPSNLSFELSTTDKSADKIFGQLALLLITPNNHGIDSSGIKTVFDAPAVSGAKVDSPELYYIYPLNLTPVTSGRITEAKIKFNATIGGVKFNAEQTYTVN